MQWIYNFLRAGYCLITILFGIRHLYQNTVYSSFRTGHAFLMDAHDTITNPGYCCTPLGNRNITDSNIYENLI